MLMKCSLRLAIWILEHAAPANEPLVGDLVEESRTRPLRVALWREVLHAVVHRSTHPDAEAGPLRLSEAPSHVTTQMCKASQPQRPISLSGGPVPGIGGLSVIALAFLVTVVSPHIWWLLGGSIVGGCVVGIVLKTMRRRAGLRVRGAPLLGAL